MELVRGTNYWEIILWPLESTKFLLFVEKYSTHLLPLTSEIFFLSARPYNII